MFAKPKKHSNCCLVNGTWTSQSTALWSECVVGVKVRPKCLIFGEVIWALVGGGLCILSWKEN